MLFQTKSTQSLDNYLKLFNQAHSKSMLNSPSLKVSIFHISCFCLGVNNNVSSVINHTPPKSNIFTLNYILLLPPSPAGQHQVCYQPEIVQHFKTSSTYANIPKLANSSLLPCLLNYPQFVSLNKVGVAERVGLMSTGGIVQGLL